MNKKIKHIASLALCLLCGSTTAYCSENTVSGSDIVRQTSTEHLEFMGIPIEGTIDQFEKKMIAKGWMPKAKTVNNGKLFEGTVL